MKAVILAAGMGRRLAAMGWTKPKCLLPCRSLGSPLAAGKQSGVDQTLLDHALSALSDHAISEFVVVVGHQRELVIQAVESKRFNVTFVTNPDFASTNTLYSLWLARKHLDDNVILMNGDLWFDPIVLDRLMSRATCALAIDEHACGIEEVKVIVGKSSHVARIGKEIHPAEAHGEYIGLARLNRQTARALGESLEARVAAGFTDEFYEAALDDILASQPIAGISIDSLPAIEIDTPEDYNQACKIWSNG